MSASLSLSCSSPISKSTGQNVRFTIVVKNTGTITIPANAYLSVATENGMPDVGWEWFTNSSIAANATWSGYADYTIPSGWAGRSITIHAVFSASKADFDSGNVLSTGMCTGLVNVGAAAPAAEIISITAA